MQNIRGIPQGASHIYKEDEIIKMQKKHNIDVYSIMETGIYDKKKPHIPKSFDKQLYNNIMNEDQNKHKTPMGAGMIIWANNKIVLQPATIELNHEKIQTTIVIIKTQ